MQWNSSDSEELSGPAPVSVLSGGWPRAHAALETTVLWQPVGAERPSVVRLAGESCNLPVLALIPSPENSVWIVWKCDLELFYFYFYFFFVPLIYKPLWGNPEAYEQDKCCFVLGPVCACACVCLCVQCC